MALRKCLEGSCAVQHEPEAARLPPIRFRAGTLLTGVQASLELAGVEVQLLSDLRIGVAKDEAGFPEGGLRTRERRRRP
jgi:hypothetical protein